MKRLICLIRGHIWPPCWAEPWATFSRLPYWCQRCGKELDRRV